jgi:transcription elongation GreA/GreB family factor
VVKNHRQHYLDRKLARSPLLLFFPGAYRIDAHDLLSGVTANLPANEGLTGVSTPESLIKNLLGSRLDATINQTRPNLIKKLEKIYKAAQDSRLSTGQHALYLGYPCVVLPGEAGKTKLAPLFMFAIDLTVTSQRITIRRRLEIEDGQSNKAPMDAIFNRLLASYIEREYGVVIGKDLHEISVNDTNVEAFVAKVFAGWSGIKNDFSFPSVSKTTEKNQLKLLSNQSDDPYIADFAIFGIADFTGQAMLDDLDKIIKMMEAGTQCPPALNSIINFAQNNSDVEGHEPSGDQAKWLVEKSDPSQEKVIWTHKVNYLTVLQGPPGTGKSQTIVNIVADALANKKTVLVVCQKRAAIEVVLKRLAAKGLGDVAVLVDDIDKDRLPVIRKLDQIEDNFNITPSQLAERSRLSDDIQDFENNIDLAVEALNDKAGGARHRYADTKSVLKRLSMIDQPLDWTTKLKLSVVEYLKQDIDLVQLNQFIETLQELDLRAKKLDYGVNLWSEIDASLADDAMKLDEVISYTKTANSIIKEFADIQFSMQHDTKTNWIAGHPWLQNQEATFQSNCLLSNAQDRAKFSKFQLWLVSIKAIAEFNPNVSVDEITKQLLNATLDKAYFEQLEKDVRNLREILALRGDIRNDLILNVADHDISHKAGNWSSDIHAMVLHQWMKDLLTKHSDGFRHAANVDSLTAQLKQRINKKRDADANNILANFDARVDARNHLKNNNLLRLRAGSGIAKTSLRRLYGNGLQQLKKIAPLLLISPETASSMLPLTPGLFDIVVIDEASQMFVAEAIPMLFRAKQAVIAGDMMQMPPSNFFAYSDDDDESYDTEDDETQPQQHIAADRVYPLLEAAENALPAGAHSKLRLEVHYRSARKELIDFSNHAFYEGKLIIPSGNSQLPDFMKNAIEFEDVRGEFKSGINDIEAKRVVEILKHIWSLPESDKPTIGVIVANVKQKERINELLQNLANNDAKFAEKYAFESERRVDDEDCSFFVRSIEHVQGDERDLIILGFTYSGNSRSFGPLKDKNDGRKRLNVAVTRAKRGMIVLNSLNVSHVSNIAERDSHERYYVWQYLRYAKAVAQDDFKVIDSILNQLNSERLVTRQQIETTDSPFEDEVKEYLESKGYYVECQVGESGFRIDLGVKVKPNSPVYLCGIECDGARYHSGWRARTNDVWRQEILESKGWNIFRVWSTDWFERLEDTQHKLFNEIDVLCKSAEIGKVEAKYNFIKRMAKDAEIESEFQETNFLVEIKDEIQPSNKNLQNANLISGDIVELGDTVTYEYLADGKIAKVKIVSGANDLDSEMLNKNTPLAKALLEADVGEKDELTYLSPRGEIKLKIISIEKFSHRLSAIN